MRQLAQREIHRRDRGIHAPELHRIPVRQIVQGLLAQVDARGDVVDSRHVDGLAVVGDAEALPAGRAVVPGNPFPSTDVGEAGDGALRLVAVAGDEPVDAVGAGNGVEAAGAVVVAGVVADGDGGGGSGEDGEDGGEGLHYGDGGGSLGVGFV